MPSKKHKPETWPCQTITVDGKQFYRLPIPDGGDVILEAGYGTPELAREVVKRNSRKWARSTFPEAFAGLA